MKSWFTAKAEGSVGEIAIFDEIGAYGITAKDFQRELRALGPVKELRVSNNSPGGEVFDGLAIHNMLRRHKANVTVTVDGIAASIASVIAMAADELVMPANAMLMVHNPSGVVVGTSKDMRELADALDKIRGSLVTAYADKTGQEAEDIVAMMDAETWISAHDAVTLGFADRIEEPVRMAASFDLSKFRNAPADAVASLRDPVALNNAEEEVTLTDENSTAATEAIEPVVEIAEAEAETVTTSDDAGITASAVNEERARAADIVAACELAGCAGKASEFIANGASLRDVLAALHAVRITTDADISARHTPVTRAVAKSPSWDKFTDRLNARNG